MRSREGVEIKAEIKEEEQNLTRALGTALPLESQHGLGFEGP